MVRIKPEHFSVLTELALQTKRSVTTEIEFAIEKYLKDLGKWPRR